MALRKVYIHRNEASADAIQFTITEDITNLTTFKKIAGEKVGYKRTPKRVFLASGAEVENLDLIRAKDYVYLSLGEPYYRISVAPGDKMNISVLGAGGVGKSAVTLRFVRDFFISNWEATIEDAYRKTVRVDGEVSIVEVLDTAGQEDFSMLRAQWMQEKDGYMFVYSLVDRESVSQLYAFVDLLEQVCVDRPVPPIVLVGNKSDLVPTKPEDEIKSIQEDVERLLVLLRQTSERLYVSWANKSSIPSSQRNKHRRFPIRHVHTSALSGEKIDEAFETLTRDIREARSDMAPPDAKPKSLWQWCSIL